MELINFKNDERLNKLRAFFGVEYNENFEICKHLGLNDIDKALVSGGIEINWEDVDLLESTSQITYKGRYVIAYIKNQTKYKDVAPSPKFHLAKCSTIKGAELRDVYNTRYHIAKQQDDNFYLKVSDSFGNEKIVKQKLLVCKNCLNAIEWKNYKNYKILERDRVFRNFSLEEYFSVYVDTMVSAPKRLKVT